ncbi:MAG: hypothetical protein KIG18_01500 [Candidatus Methanomethylophilaceae archaeon]|nr:hypothetical protein [Candidatus Methanomethylophilaceae archaeon]
MSDTKIVGIKKAAHDMLWAPKGFHCEIWAKRNGKKVVLWTSEYLTPESWTSGIEGFTRIDRRVREYKNIGYTWTKAIRIAAEKVGE